MASDINHVTLIGRTTKDIDVRYTQGGIPVASFSLANNRTYKKDGEKTEQVSFFNCVAWNKIGELIAQYVKKGNRIAIEGRIQQRSWDDTEGKKRSTVEIVVENVQFLEPRGESGGGNSVVESNRENDNISPEPLDGNPFSDDDIPF